MDFEQRTKVRVLAFGKVALAGLEQLRDSGNVSGDAKKWVETSITFLSDPKKVSESDKKFIKDGDDGDKPEYEGYYTVSARESRRPSVRHRNGEPMSEKEIQDIIYAGCRVNILIRPWFQDNAFGKRINAGLMAVQFARDDEQIGEGRIDDEGVFESLDDGDDGMGGSSSSDDDL